MHNSASGDPEVALDGVLAAVGWESEPYGQEAESIPGDSGQLAMKITQRVALSTLSITQWLPLSPIFGVVL